MAKRRTYGTGSLRLRGRKWYIGYRVPGQPHQQWEPASPDRKEAEALLHERLAAVRRSEDQGSRGRRRGLLFEDVADEWLARRKGNPKLSPRTVEIDKIALDCHLRPAFGMDRLDEIDADAIDQYKDAKLAGVHPVSREPLPVAGKGRAGKPMSPRSVNQHLSVLSQVFRHAQRRHGIEHNPARLVDRVKEEPELVEPLERDQVRALIAAIEDEGYRMLVSTLARLGLRLGEALALRGSDYMADERVLKVRRTLRREGGKVRAGDYPKTRAGQRDLTVSDGFHADLMAHMSSAHSGAGTERDLIFCNELLDVINPSNFRSRVWAPALEAAGLPEATTPHHLRHTYASEQIAANAADTAIAYRMGHRDSNVTRKFYGHIFARHRDEAADLTVYDDEPVHADEPADIDPG
jgi:integrase